MRSITRGLFAGAVALSLAGTASAQIISTSIPKGPEAKSETGFNFHLMAGYTYWDFAAIEKLKQESTSGSGGHSGWIGAGDLVFRASSDVSLGVGGWYNIISDYTTECTSGACLYGPFDTTHHDNGSSLNAYSVYASVFYKRVGLQGGLVHSSSSENVSINQNDGAILTATDSPDSNDKDLFLVYRGGGKKTSFSVGAGLYEYADQPARDIRVLYNGTPAFFVDNGQPFILNIPATESTTSFSAFANASVGLSSKISIDASYWFIGSSGKDATGAALNDTVSRFTIGLGVTL